MPAALYGLWLAVGVSISLGLAGLALAGIAHWRLQRQQRATRRLLASVGQRLQALTAGTIGMGERLVDFESSLKDARTRQEEIENRDPGQLPYRQASRLIRMGARAEDLMSACGLSRAEAELAVLLGGPDASQGPTASARH